MDEIEGFFFFFFAYDLIKHRSKSRQIEMAPENLATPAAQIGGLGGTPSPREAHMPYTSTYTGVRVPRGSRGADDGGRGTLGPPHRRMPV